jgi:hypothetical protein
MNAMNQPASVRAHILRNYRLEGWKEKIAGRWSYRDLQDDAAWFKGWISFDAITWNPYDKQVYCGLNSMDADLLYRFDPATERFESMNTQKWADKFDVKIHRTLLLNPKDHSLYFATSLLHDLDQQHAAKGGKLVKFDPATRAYHVIGIPLPHLYIQSIAADWERGIIYSFTAPAEALVGTDLATGGSRLLAYLTNASMFVQPHNAVVDKEGWLWGTYGELRAWDETPSRNPVRLFKYRPDSDQFVWFEHGLSKRSDKPQLLPDPPQPPGVSPALDETCHKEDFGFCDSMAYDGERYIYAGTVAGVLSRVDTQTGEVEKVANITATGRLPALSIKDHILYGGGGMNGCTQLVRWDTRTEQMDGYTDLHDPQTRTRPARIHEIAVDDDHRIYFGENDNHARSSYLWSVRLE